MPTPIALDKIYTEIRAGIRETDSISFKLLGLVPLVSGTALIGLILQSELPYGLVILLALFASTVTLGLFRWELRNVQTCSRLLTYADAIEKHALHPTVGAICPPRQKPPQDIGKTEAEKVIYTTTVVAWLALPFSVETVPPPTDSIVCAYAVVASAVLVVTLISLLAETRPDDGVTKDSKPE